MENRATRGELKPLTWPPMHVEVRVPSEMMRPMIARVEENFEHMGRTEPHFSVLSDPQYLPENIDGNEENFYTSGKGPVDALVATAARCGVKLSSQMRCFELGCGVGRITNWLAELFGEVVASDISRPHLELAEANARRFGKANISFLKLDRIDAINNIPDFDVFFSIIVLQHNPPPIIYALLKAALEKLNPGGVAYFQVPTYRLGYNFNAAEYLAASLKVGVPEMHVLPQPALFDLLEETRCRVREIREDGAAGGQNISSRIFAMKRLR